MFSYRIYKYIFQPGYILKYFDLNMFIIYYTILNIKDDQTMKFDIVSSFNCHYFYGIT